LGRRRRDRPSGRPARRIGGIHTKDSHPDYPDECIDLADEHSRHEMADTDCLWADR
jgi:hypothetical protein